jgi:hypothetical protein
MSGLRFVLATGSPAEVAMRDLLERLARDYDLSAWTFTDTVRIDEAGFPHSHPVLTMSTERREEPLMVLAELVHEQLHWYEESHADRRDRAIAATRLPYPVVPSARPEGAGDETSTRLHLIVCWLELEVLALLVGPAAAHDVGRAMSEHHYRWLYRTVLADGARIGELVAAHDLLPEPLRGSVGSSRGGR